MYEVPVWWILTLLMAAHDNGGKSQEYKLQSWSVALQLLLWIGTDVTWWDLAQCREGHELAGPLF